MSDLLKNAMSAALVYLVAHLVFNAPVWAAETAAALAFLLFVATDRITNAVAGAMLIVLARVEQQEEQGHEQAVAEIASRQ